MTGTSRGILVGRRALVTGAGVGIGQAVGLGLAAEGADVVFHYHDHLEGAESAAAKARAVGSNAWAIGADLSKVDEVVRLIGQSVEHLGGLDILVNNSGITYIADIADTEVATFDLLFAVNVRAGFIAVKTALPHLVKSECAVVINTTSGHGVAGFPGFSAYACTKGAIIALTRQLAIELAPRRIRVNAVGPGYIEVPRYLELNGYDPDLGSKIVPIGRSGYPQDIAGAVVYLVSDAASFVTGQVLFIDGGTTARMGLHWPELEPEVAIDG